MSIEGKKIKVLFVANVKICGGGISNQVKILNNCLSKEGFVSKILSTDGNLIKKLFSFFELLKHAREFDVIHAHGCSGWGFLPIFYALAIGRFTKKRVIVTYHGGGAEAFLHKKKILLKYCFEKADVITVPSGFLKEIFSKFGYSVEILPNIIDPLKFRYAHRKTFRPNIIIARSLEKLYNIKCGIKAFSIVKQQFPEAKLFVVGHGSKGKELMRLVQKLKLKDVFFRGPVENDNMGFEYDGADIFLNPANADNMPVSVLEAFASGLVVVSTNVGGIPYIIDDSRTGLLVKPNNPVDMADKLIYILNNQVVAQKISKNAFIESKKYVWENIREKLLDFYLK